jgi:hypothetical protein
MSSFILLRQRYPVRVGFPADVCQFKMCISPGNTIQHMENSQRTSDVSEITGYGPVRLPRSLIAVGTFIVYNDDLL